MHHTNARFWNEYHKLPEPARLRAEKAFALLKANPLHPSLHFKKLGERKGQEIWSARVSLNHRALALKLEGGYLWFWIGEHGAYDAILK